jgi:hypothetical protein
MVITMVVIVTSGTAHDISCGDASVHRQCGADITDLVDVVSKLTDDREGFGKLKSLATSAGNDIR